MENDLSAKVRRQTIGAVAAVLIAGLPTYWALIDIEPPLVIRSATVETPAVHPGDVLMIRFVFDRARACPGKVVRYLLDGDQVRRQLLPFEIGPGEIVRAEAQTLPVEIPASTAAGVAIYRSSIEYYCNPWQRLVWPLEVVLPAQTFTVLPRPAKG